MTATRMRVARIGQCVEAIGDQAEKAALMFQFHRTTGPPPFEISNLVRNTASSGRDARTALRRMSMFR
ncbi:hypothetical protein ACWDXH_10560 [Micromonospora chokoriensis]